MAYVHHVGDPMWAESLERDHRRYLSHRVPRADEAASLAMKFRMPQTTYQSTFNTRTHVPKPLIPDEDQYWGGLTARMLERREPHNIFNVSDDMVLKTKTQRLRAQIAHERSMRQQAEDEIKSRRDHEAQELRLYQRTRRGLRLSPRMAVELQQAAAEEAALHRSRPTRRSTG